jgi:hypothetical protein
MDFLCVMHECDRMGVITGTREQLARLGRCSAVELDQALSELSTSGAATVTRRNKEVTLENRRMKRERKAREYGAKRQERFRRNAHVTPLSHDTSESESESEKNLPVRSEEDAPGLPVDKSSNPEPGMDYETATPPEIRDYTDIHGCPDPILAAMAITGERDKRAWGHWVKTLNQARRDHGAARADRLFRGCLAELFGEMRGGEVKNPGALLNHKLAKTFG